MDGTSLSRYLPNRAKSLELKSEYWLKWIALFGDNDGVLSSLARFTQKDAAIAMWDNMWRAGSPFCLLDKWRWLRSNAEYFESSLIVVFLLRTMKMLVRRYFYFSWIYKIHVKKLYSDFVGLKAAHLEDTIKMVRA